MRNDWLTHPIARDELPPVERLRRMLDWFDDYEPDDAYDVDDDPMTDNQIGFPR